MLSKQTLRQGGGTHNRTSYTSQGLHLQYSSEESFGHIPQCTECSQPRQYTEVLQCNGVPGQSRGPHLQCTEKPIHHCTVPSAQHREDRGRCTECRGPENYGQHELRCNSIPGQSQGPHLQSTKGPLNSHAIPSAQRQNRGRCTECSRMQNYGPEKLLLCNSVPGQSRGPHLQCTEQ